MWVLTGDDGVGFRGVIVLSTFQSHTSQRFYYFYCHLAFRMFSLKTSLPTFINQTNKAVKTA